MVSVPRQQLLRYALAVLSVACATGLTLLVPTLAERAVFLLFFPAITLSAWYGGRGPGLLATVLSAMACAYFVLPPVFSFAVGLVELLRLGVFIFVALLISTLSNARRRAEELARRNERWLRTTLRSIGDAVIATDKAGRIVYMNVVAQQLTGWPDGDAHGRDLSEVLHIVNEQTRAAVDSPVKRALREDSVVGLAKHTMLIARDGTERLI
ncbi:MAG TPA: DUF4118 domain-containing protein, partial [Pyrinomonadaceae bacterium]|nr:DUF4118 domain-containing protein [Pyrinomonadaceae bacterium]